ncbi:glycine cleavage system protein R [Cerasicoccus fimbriatus]|uniref:glycine cleavage system protein R n=1 Tax=Cerasicoccus fimbriatus TaxID=3014554 RepID=UPI0022B3BF4F|nr:ACT domain-containing protein [Cerasicoccus sp. TK19100]
MSHSSLILTLSGRDQPGLVERMARVIAENGGNWEQSRMAHLAQRFVGLLEVHVANDQAAALCDALREIPDLELTMHVEEKSTAPSGPCFSLDLLGGDQPGIVQKISRALAAAGVNIEELTTSTEAAPDSGAPLFRAKMRLSGGGDDAQQAIQAELESIAHDLMVDLTLAR